MARSHLPAALATTALSVLAASCAGPPRQRAGKVRLRCSKSPTAPRSIRAPRRPSSCTSAGDRPPPQRRCTCQCAPPAQVTCSAPVATIWAHNCGNTCPGPGGPAEVTVGDCTPLGRAAMSCGMTEPYIRLGPSLAEGGSCAPSFVVDAGPIEWTAEARLCEPTQPSSGCFNVCPTDAATSPPPFCVVQGGADASACPAPYIVVHSSPDGGQYTASAHDGRTCAYSCGTPSGIVCDSSAALFDSQDCINSISQLQGGGACSELVGIAAASSTSAPEDGGSCAPLGGPTGEVTPGPAVTICCTR
jgi:hypothetical protein